MDGPAPHSIHEPVFDDLLEYVIVGDHGDDDVSTYSVGERRRSFGPGCYEFVGARRRAVPDSYVKAATNESGCHRATHISETNEGCVDWTSHVSPRKRSQQSCADAESRDNCL